MVEKTAREFIEWHGTQAVLVLLECADSAAASGNVGSAEIWRELAHAAERLQR
jgi:hypothetical protein